MASRYLAWVDGQVMALGQAALSPSTPALHYGYGAFEGIRAYAQAAGGAAIFRLDDHMRRLASSCAVLQLALPFALEALGQACRQLVDASGAANVYLRPLILAGGPDVSFAHWNNPVRAVVLCYPWTGYPDRDPSAGMSAVVSPVRRSRTNPTFNGVKLCGGYLPSVVAYTQAVRAGAQQAIMLDEDGTVCETTSENLFIVRAGEIFTAPSDSPILPGFTRDTVIHLARRLGYPVHEEPFDVAALCAADEVFATGTVAGVLAISAVDGRPIGSGKRGSLTQALTEALDAVVRGEEPSCRHWLTPAP